MMVSSRCICLAGPTAAGKTACALAIAEALRKERPVEIVSVDSALVYRGMDIGTAKPSAAERAAVPHHLIDIIEPTQRYSAAQFVADAQRLIGDIEARGHLPLLVGGTMLYFKALFDGIDAMPAADPAVRAELDARAAREGWPALHAELARIDPVTAARLPPTDSQRIQRALEVWQLSGQPLSGFHARASRRELSASGEPATPALISLEPNDRAWLHRRIGERFDAMLEAGLVEEVRSLRARGDLHAELPAMRCVGYRQVWQALNAGLTGNALLDAVRETGRAATRQLAKRQITWLRSMPQRQVIACDADGALESAVRAALAQARSLTGHRPSTAA
jgi:tRNA dimethylallyltransferase